LTRCTANWVERESYLSSRLAVKAYR